MQIVMSDSSRLSTASALSLFALFLLPAPALPRTWQIHVDGSGDAPTIQAGIDSSADGDTVLALPGTYFENINFKGKAIVVTGSDRSTTILDGGGTEESTVLFTSGEDRGSILEKFAITHGSGHLVGGVRWGGGVFCHGASPTVRDNTIEFNEAVTGSGSIYSGRGGGLYFTNSDVDTEPFISGNTIRYNDAGSNGGGVACDSGVRPIIRGNLIVGNQTFDGDGAGIWLFTWADGALVEDNWIEANDAGDHGGGIFIDGERSSYPYVSYEIRGNVILRNVARFHSSFLISGGGIVIAAANAWVHQNTIVENWGAFTGTSGGGIAVDESPGTVIERNIIAFTKSGGGILCWELGGAGVIRNNLAWMNAGGDGVGSCAGWWQTDGNVVANPHFCDLAGDNLTLAENSLGLTHIAGPLGAIPIPGCGPVAVELTTWGRLKARYGSR